MKKPAAPLQGKSLVMKTLQPHSLKKDAPRSCRVHCASLNFKVYLIPFLLKLVSELNLHCQVPKDTNPDPIPSLMFTEIENKA